APVVSCGTPEELESITFNWDPVVGATGYELDFSDGNSATLTAAETSFTVSGLDPGTTLTISIYATGTGPCPDGPTTTLECSTAPCPPGLAMATTPDTEFCNGQDTDLLPLSATLTAGTPQGSFTWSGPGVVVNNGNFFFDPTAVGPGVHVLTVAYDGPSICDSQDEVTMTIFGLPLAGLDPTPAQVCAGTAIDVSLADPVDAGTTYVWDWDGGIPTDLGNQTYSVRWDTPGTKTVTITATAECTVSNQFTIEVTPTLAAPVPFCARQDLDGVLFEWPLVPEAILGYQVSVNGGPFGATQAENSFFIGGLGFGETVSIRVRSVRSGTTCDLSPASADVACSARLCPQVTFAPAAAQTEFCADATTRVTLMANLSGADGSGVTTWTGPGVIANNDGSFSFDPSVAGIGQHLLRVSYVQEALCSYEDVLLVEVFALPAADFSVSDDLICAATNTALAVLGTVDPQATYTWDFAGAAVTDNGNQRYDLRWPLAGTYAVSLTVTANGCATTTSQMVTVEMPVSAGTAAQDALERCVGTTEMVDLSSRLTGADAGGVWSVVTGSGVPNGSLDPATGQFNPAGLAPGNYRFAYTVEGGSCPDATAEVSLRLLAAPVANAGQGQTLTCNTGMVTLNGSASEMGPGYTYLWTSADPNVVIMDADQLLIDVGQPGVYRLEVTNAIGCSAFSEVTVDSETEAPVMEVEISQISCFQADDGAILVTGVNGGRPPYRFLLNGEERGQTTLFGGLMPQQYDLQVIDANGCFSNILLDLTQPEELTIRLRFPGDSASVNYGEEIFITASINGGNAIDTLLWQPDSLKTDGETAGISFVARETQMISVTVVDELGCRATDRQMLLVRKDRPVYFPTAFSPNGDNINDIFFINGDLDEVESIQDFAIYDRWGEAVFTANLAPTADGSLGGFLPNDPAFGWDGFHKGRVMNPQVFVYSATVRFRDGETVVYKGDFVLLR
ncbi:gliding motility-associated C-terminal domain-containing protein, partial [Lewinella lacunae]